MLRCWLHLLLCLTLLATAIATAWSCPQLAAAWVDSEVVEAGCPHHRDTTHADNDRDTPPGKSQCCCPAPLPPTLSVAAPAPRLTAAPPRWNVAPPPAPVPSPPLRPPATMHA